MLSMDYIIENKEKVKQMIKDREKEVDVDLLIQTYHSLNSIKKEVEGLRQKRNSSSNEVNKLKKEGKNANNIISQMKEVVLALKEKEPQLEQLQKNFDMLKYQVPNILDDRVPRGNENKEEYIDAQIKEFSFEPKTNWDVLTDLGLADFKRGIKASGDRGWILNGDGARLVRAITNYLLDFWRAKGYFEVHPPYFVNEENLYITGHYPGGEKEVYRTEDGKVFVGTAEISIMSIYANETFNKKNLPLKITAYTPCFRREAGTNKDDKGLYRTHQFDKVELIHITTKEKVQEEYEGIFENMKELYKSLELPFRIITLRANDMAGKAKIERDMEVWLGAEKRWAEVGSIGDTGDFQCRRGNIRYEGDGKLEYAHSIYATGGVANRILISILNNNQKEDGTITIPKVLQPYVGGMKLLKKIDLI
ncbi:MAG: serine--tRNA ligase [Candidatus Nanoarchaeia archaeon]|nr:serine--tRNA ligase [Candidatus Nanoarchaeia archaeon]